MDEITFYPSVFLSLILIIIYLIKSIKSKCPVDVASVIKLVFDSGGIVVGIFLLLSTLIKSIDIKLNNIKIYIFIGGLAIIIVSCQAIINEFKKNIKDKNEV